jgi:uncharacterized Zn-binding protein involved in type VI secretion
MCKPAARVGDATVCPASGPRPHVGGPIATGSPNVYIDGRAAARVGDPCNCDGVPTTAPVAKGSNAVLINGKAAARMSDPTRHGGMIVAGSPKVMIGNCGDIGVAPEVVGEIFVDGHVLIACGCPPEHQINAVVNAKRAGKPFCEVCECGG